MGAGRSRFAHADPTRQAVDRARRVGLLTPHASRALGGRWLGQAQRAQDIALACACGRQAFGKPLVEHEGVGFMRPASR